MAKRSETKCLLLLLVLGPVVCVLEADENNEGIAASPDFSFDDELQNVTETSTSLENRTTNESPATTPSEIWSTPSRDTPEGNSSMTPEPFGNVTMSNATTTSWAKPTTDLGTPPPCDDSMCHSRGTCVPGTGESDFEFRCSCDRGFTGARCQIRDLCGRNEANVTCSGGACVYSEDMTARYCKCFSGTYWDPKAGECKHPHAPCFPNPCSNNGVCTPINHHDYTCSCADGFTGRTCELKDYCGLDAEGSECGRGICMTDYQNEMTFCECDEGHYVHPKTHVCTAVNKPCEPNPCSGHGRCTDLSDGVFNCTCEKGYAGPLCEIQDRCFIGEDGVPCDNGTCVKYEDRRVQFCLCNEGYFQDPETGKCREIRPPCEPNPCDNGGVCKAFSEDEFNCTCAEGYVGDTCGDRDRCVLDGGNAFCGGATCVMDHADDLFYCLCLRSDEYFDYKSRQCKGIDFCPLMTCGANEVCENSACVCEDGFKKDEEGQCRADYCTKYGCPADGMICEESTNGSPEDFKCFCEPGFSFNGAQCVHAACEFSAKNNCSQICQATENSFKCDCAEGFNLGSDMATCEYAQATKCENLTCSPGYCVKINGRHVCLCPPGYVEKDGICEDLCSAGELPEGICPEDKCTSVSGKGFRCVCEGKYDRADDGVTCTVRKLCRPGEAGWSDCRRKLAECVEDWHSPKGYECRCPLGFEGTQSGKCQEICDVPANQRACSRMGGVCRVDKNYHLSCECPAGFTTNVPGGSCKTIADVSYVVTLPLSAGKYRKKSSRSRRSLHEQETDYRLLRTDVVDSMEHLFETFRTANILNCWLASDEVLLCRIELQFEDLEEKVLDRLKSPSSCKCNQTISDTTCLLPPSLVLVEDEIESQVKFQKTSLCDPNIKEEVCGSETACEEFQEGKSFTCTCSPGFRARERVYPAEDDVTYIERCKDVDECKDNNPCPVNSRCVNTIGSYKCLCLPGYRTTNDTVETRSDACVELCNPNPCMHGKCVRSGDYKVDCKCEAGYGGSRCDFEDKNYKAANVRAVTVGAVLGGVLLITVILFIATVSRLKKKKYLDNTSQVLYSTEMTERRPVRMSATNTAFERD